MTPGKIVPNIQGDENKKGGWRYLFKHFDALLFGLVLFVTVMGIFVIYGATYQVPGLSQYAWKQVIWVGLGVTVLFILCLVDFRHIRQLVLPLYFIVMASLILLPFLGHKVKGARSWYALGSYRIQPAEFAKIIVVVCLAHYLASRDFVLDRIRDIIFPLFIAGIPAVLIFIQPDFGTASLFFPILLIMLYVAGTSKKLLVLLMLMAIWAGTAGYPFLKPYQKARIKVFLHPEHDHRWLGYNIRQSEISLGSGGLWGKGWKQGTQTRLRFLPERHTDFIFSSLGEQFGFMGCAGLLILYCIITLRTLRLASRTLNKFGRLVIVGMISCFLLHIIFNIGMSLRLMPVTGLPLPLFSYGGSFLLTNYIIFGIIESISMRRFYY